MRVLQRTNRKAEQNGSDLGSALGLAVGAVMALTTEEQEECNEYYVEEETWQQTM